MKCPHCTTSFHEGWNSYGFAHRADGSYVFDHLFCPECRGLVMAFRRVLESGVVAEHRLIWPTNVTRPVAPEVGSRFADDFRGASATLSVSPKASAALSRRCLQDVLREKAGVKKPTLDAEIQTVIDSGKVPTWLAENLDAVRVVGNFAAHPVKSTNTGEVVDVEDGEAEFLLDVLEGVFDFYFVQPEKAKQQRAAINAKLQEAGKPPLKTA